MQHSLTSASFLVLPVLHVSPTYLVYATYASDSLLAACPCPFQHTFPSIDTYPPFPVYEPFSSSTSQKEKATPSFPPSTA